MYRVLIVDDDAAAAATVRTMVEQHPRAAEFEIEIAESPSLEGDSSPEGHMPDIAIVDIDLGEEYGNGIDLVRKRFPKDSGTQVVYVTGYIEYCTAVYQTEHVSFLVKPLKQEELDDALDRALRNIDQGKREVLAVQARGVVRLVPSARIEYIESRLRKVYVHAGGKVLEMYATLSDVEEQLPSYFVRCHKSYLVNMKRVVEIHADSLLMRSGESVPVSQARRKEVKERFARALALPLA